MKKIDTRLVAAYHLRIIAAVILALVWSDNYGQTISGTGNPQPIPVSGTGGFPCIGGPTSSIASFGGTGVVGATHTIAQVEINLTHTFDADLDIELIAPSGTTWGLSSDNGADGDDFTNTVFADGFPSITTGSPPFTGTFEAEEGPLNTGFDGECMNGNWTLSICDDSGGDTGNLLSWSMTFLPVNGIVISGTGNPQPIPPAGTGGFPCVDGPTTSAANFSGAGTVGTTHLIHSVTLDLTHTFAADLDIELMAPSGAIWELSSDNGADGDNYTNTVFADGFPSITTGSPPFTGTFEAEDGPLNTGFDGEDMNGNWTVNICDDSGGDIGTLLSWSMAFVPNTCADDIEPPLISCVVGGGNCGNSQTFMGNGNPQPIPVSGTGGFPCIGGPTTSDATVTAMGTVGETHAIRNIQLDLDHTFAADLDIELIAPSGTIWGLSSDNGADGDDYTNTIFMDGFPSITTGVPPFAGIFEAEQPFPRAGRVERTTRAATRSPTTWPRPTT
jgi:subtilisin-like proprotein convertase family protein